MRGRADVLTDVVTELRSRPALTDKLPDAEAVYQGHPTEDRGYAVAVVVTIVSAGSTPHHSAVSRNYRVQVTVTATTPWREAQDNASGTTALTEMYAIMDAVGDVLDVGSGIDEYGTGAGGGPGPQQVGDGRLAITDDWFVSGTYLS